MKYTDLALEAVLTTDETGFVEESETINRYLVDTNVTTDDTEAIISGLKKFSKSETANEYNERNPSFNPTAMTVEVAKNLSAMSDEVSKIAPIKYLDGKDLKIDVPTKSVGTIENGTFVERSKVSDLDINTVDEIIASVKPTFNVDTEQFLDVETKRAGTISEFTASLLTGKEIPVFGAATEQKDLGLIPLGESDILKAGGRLTRLNVKIDEGINSNVITLATDEIIAVANIFKPGAEGKKHLEEIKAKFTFLIDNDTKSIISGESINNGTLQTATSLAALTPGKTYAIEVTVMGSADLLTPTIHIEHASFKVVKSMVGGVESAVTPTDKINDLTFSLQSFDAELGLTNNNTRETGLYGKTTNTEYNVITNPKGIYTDELPVNAKDAVSSVTQTLAEQSGKIKINVIKNLVSDLAKFAVMLNTAIKMGVQPNVATGNIFRPVYVKSTGVNTGNVTVQRSDQTISQELALYKIEIENIAKEIIKKSGWRHNLKTSGISGYSVKVLAPINLGLMSFKMSDNTSVDVANTDYLNDRIYVTLEAHGGPSFKGIKLFSLASTIMRPSVTYVGVKGTGTAVTKFVTTSPEYKTLFKLPILGEIAV